MVYAIFFCSALALGFLLGIVTWAFASFLAEKVASRKYQARMIDLQMQEKRRRQEIDVKISKLRAAAPDMTPQQEDIARDELETGLFQSRDRGQVKRNGP